MSSGISQSFMCIGIRILSLLWACRIVHAVASSSGLDARNANNPATYNSSVNATASDYPKFPDFITCNGYYGVELQDVTCKEALANLFPTSNPRQYVQFTTKGPGRYSHPTFLVPVRRADHPDLSLCILTIDLAGQSNRNDPLGITVGAVKELASAVIDKCIGGSEGPQTGGFGTIRLSDTVSGMANARPAPHGYDAPKFLTVSITGRGPYYGPGNFDPDVNEQLQVALQAKYNSAILKQTKAKIATVINALAAVYGDMRRTAQKAWWDNTHYVPEIPENVSNLCRRNLGHPDPSDCERASFNFIKSGSTPRIEPRTPLEFISGTCVFELSTEDEPLTTSWDIVRSVADSLMNECLLAPGAQMTGGETISRGLAQNRSGTTNLSSRDSVENSSSAINAVQWPQSLLLTMKMNPNPIAQTCSNSGSTVECSPSNTTGNGVMASSSSVSDVASS